MNNPLNLPEITLHSPDGMTVRVELHSWAAGSLTPAEARDLAARIMRAAEQAEMAPAMCANHHVNLRASCPVCRYFAGGQADRLDTAR